jgi:hypothetical protein
LHRFDPDWFLEIFAAFTERFKTCFSDAGKKKIISQRTEYFDSGKTNLVVGGE